MAGVFAGRLPGLFMLYVMAVGLGACGPAAETGEAPGPLAEGQGSKPAGGGVTLFANANIYTFDEIDSAYPNGALAVASNGRILAVGEALLLLSDYPDAARVDLAGRTVLPGLIDSHGHLYGLAQSYTRADLVGTSGKAEVIQRLQAFESGLPEGEWLLGRGWDQNDWEASDFPSSADLDAVFPERPVWLERIDGHAGWANSAALIQADRDLSGDWQMAGGAIHRDAFGQPTGILVDGAMELVEQVIPSASPAAMDQALDRAIRTLLGFGLTGVHDPGVDRMVLEVYRGRLRQGRLPVRVYAMAGGVGPTLDWLCAAGSYSDPSGRLQMRAVKLFADGALGSRGAALLAPYADDPDNQGLLFATDAGLQEQMRRVMACGLQLGVHAIGDRANRQVLDAYAALQPLFPDNPRRHRIEHVQILAPDDIPRFAELGVVAAMQPIHATSDMYWASGRLGSARLSGTYAWRSLRDSGAVLAFGSDFPVEAVNPMLGIYAAVTRQDLQGRPDGGWQPQERLSRVEAVRSFTVDAAWAGFQEDELGSLEPGKRADFIVLDLDLMQIPAGEIPSVQVLQTWVDGQPVYAR